MYEHRTTPPLSRLHFFLRLVNHALIAAGLLVLSLAVGMWGYGHYEHLEWQDAFLNACMLLGGMGPVDSPATPEGKVFAGTYALYAGLVFILVAGLLVAPAFHRVLHRFHWGDE